VREPAPPPSSASELEIPSALDAVVLACLEKDPARRSATADKLARLLGEANAGRWWQIHNPLPVAATAAGSSPSRR
jgi:hypothetical protein